MLSCQNFSHWLAASDNSLKMVHWLWNVCFSPKSVLPPWSCDLRTVLGKDMAASFYHAEKIYKFQGFVFNRFMYWQPVQAYDVTKFGISTNDIASCANSFACIVNGFEGNLVIAQKLYYCSLVLKAPMTLQRIYVSWKNWRVWRFLMSNVSSILYDTLTILLNWIESLYFMLTKNRSSSLAVVSSAIDSVLEWIR